MHSKLIITAALLAGLGAAPAAHAAFPGTNGDILFGAYDMGTDEAGLYATKPGGTPSLLASTGFDTPNHVDVSPDGERIVWSANDYKIWVADRDGTDATQISPEERRDWTPSWSPDSRSIVFAERDENNEWMLARMSADGSGRQRIGDGIQGIEPALSPDGKTIAYAGFEEYDYAGDLNLVDAAGQTAPVEIAQGIDPDWTPDGRSLVFMYFDYEAFQLALYKVDVATEEITPITELGGDVAYGYPSVSPDGTRIVAASARVDRENRGYTSDYALRTMNIDGSDVEVLADTATARYPDWAPGPPAPRQDDEEEQQQPPIGSSPQPVQAATGPRAAAPSLGARVCRSRRYFTVSVRGSRIGRVAMTLAGRRLKVRRGDGRFTARVDLRQLPKGRFTVKIRKTLKGGGTRSETRRYRTCVPKRG